MKFFNELNREEDLKEKDDLISILDYCFKEVRSFVHQGSTKLNCTRNLFRNNNKIEALKEFNSFKKLCLDFTSSLEQVEFLIKQDNINKKVVKIIWASKEIIEKSTQRNLKTKIPMPDIDYLNSDVISESDIDWIIKKMKNFWGKYLQVYGSLRIDISLSNKSDKF
ncbi:MAG: hypothetical protein R2828_21755 [Saprospiraceae bacterium]